MPRLLVVEDDPDQSRMLCDRLKLYGYAVACANDGPAALEMLEADSYHGVLLDLNLPDMPGHRVLEQARQSWPHLPVLVMSASQNGVRTLKEADPTACTYLVKPYNSSELKQALVKSFGPRPESIEHADAPLGGHGGMNEHDASRPVHDLHRKLKEGEEYFLRYHILWFLFYLKRN